MSQNVPTSQPHQRLDSIDALRGIAAMMVALYHVWGHYGLYPWPSLGVVAQELHPSIFSIAVSPLRWGYLGVSLFLVLSGFCIHLPFARTKQQEGSYRFAAKPFYLRRMWRLYPAYLVSLVGTFVLQLTANSLTPGILGFPPSIKDLFLHLTFLHGFSDSSFYGIVTVYWSIALEFQLYLLYPFFLFIFRKIGLTNSIGGLILASLVWRFVALDVWHFQLISVAMTGPYSMMGCVFARMPEWLCGVWLAEWFVSNRGRVISGRRLPLALSGVVVLFVAILTTLFEPAWILTDIVFGLGFALVVASAITPVVKKHSQKAASLRSLQAIGYRSLIWLGTISYSLYLFHMQLSWFANAWLRKMPVGPLPFLLRALSLVISLPLIAFVYRKVEAPFSRLPKPGEQLYPLYKTLRKLIGIKKDVVAPVPVSATSNVF